MQQHSVVYKTLSGECKSVLFNDRGMKKGTGTQITEGYKTMIIYNGNEAGLFFWLPPTMTRRREIQK